MNAELEKWIDKNEALAGEFSSGLSVVPSYKLIALFDNKVLVPVEPTDAMIDALFPGTGTHTCRELYKAMLAALEVGELQAIIDNKENT
jgi:hypothetical protein